MYGHGPCFTIGNMQLIDGISSRNLLFQVTNGSSLDCPSISLPIETKKVGALLTGHLSQVPNGTRKISLLADPIANHMSNIHDESILPKINQIQKQKFYRPSLMVSSGKELTASSKDWKLHHSLIGDMNIDMDSSLPSSTIHIPLVMITDTNSSYTNIVELDTFEDKYRHVSDIERLLSRELRASYRPRHST
jgi:hypothetical protein